MPPAETKDPLGIVGKDLDGHQVQDYLGCGTFGHVYRGYQTKMSRPVALKFLREGMEEDVRKRFEQEAKLPSQMPSQIRNGTAQTINLLEFGSRPCIVMEYIEGTTLRKRLLREGVIELRDALFICHEVAKVLACAHARDIIHRDIKPENIMLVEDEAGVQVKILDWGIAHAVNVGRESMHTRVPIGTPAYMAPDHWPGHDARIDVFALGTVLYEMLTGELPDGDQRYQPTPDVDEPPLTHRLLRKTPGGVKLLIAKCLASRSCDRLSMSEVQAGLSVELRRYQRDRIGPRLWGLATGTMVVGVLIGGAATRLYQRGGDRTDDAARHKGEAAPATVPSTEGSAATVPVTEVALETGGSAARRGPGAPAKPVEAAVALRKAGPLSFVRHALALPDADSLLLLSVWGDGRGGVYAAGQRRQGGALRGVLISSPDGGRSWREWRAPQGGLMYGVWGAGQGRVYGVGAAGTIVVSEDQGEIWQPLQSPTRDTLMGIWGSSADDIYVVGDRRGLILRSTDGGQHFRAERSVTGNGLRSIWGSGPDDIWAVGWGGTIVRRDRAGFRVARIGTDEERLYGVWGSGAGEVYAVGTAGEGGLLLRSTDGGKRWQAERPTNPCFAVWGVDAQDVYVVGAGQARPAMARLGQGGLAPWQIGEPGVPYQLKSIWGTERGDVFVVGSRGTLFRTERQ